MTTTASINTIVAVAAAIVAPKVQLIEDALLSVLSSEDSDGSTSCSANAERPRLSSGILAVKWRRGLGPTKCRFAEHGLKMMHLGSVTAQRREPKQPGCPPVQDTLLKQTPVPIESHGFSTNPVRLGFKSGVTFTASAWYPVTALASMASTVQSGRVVVVAVPVVRVTVSFVMVVAVVAVVVVAVVAVVVVAVVSVTDVVVVVVVASDR